MDIQANDVHQTNDFRDAAESAAYRLEPRGQDAKWRNMNETADYVSHLATVLTAEKTRFLGRQH